MGMPGFTAAASIYKSNRPYIMKGAPSLTGRQLITPAAFGGGVSPIMGDCMCYEWEVHCQWVCTGSNPQICRRYCYPECVVEIC